MGKGADMLGDLLARPMGLGSEWEIVSPGSREAKGGRDEPRIRVAHVRGQPVECPECGRRCGACDTRERGWRHLDIRQPKAIPAAPCRAASAGSTGPGACPWPPLTTARGPGGPYRGLPGRRLAALRRAPHARGLIIPAAPPPRGQDRGTGLPGEGRRRGPRHAPRGLRDARRLLPQGRRGARAAGPDALACLDLPPSHRERLRASDVQGRYSRETRRRTRVVQALPSVRPPGRLVGAVRCNEGEEWSRARYLSEGRMAESHAPRTSTEP